MNDTFLLRHAEELAGRAEYEIQFTPFLTPAEQREIYESLPAHRKSMLFWGGTEGADRRRAIFFPDWMKDASPNGEKFSSIGGEGAFSSVREELARELWETYPQIAEGFVPVEISGSSFVSLSHRDYLGAVMNLGLERETLGDIIPTSDHSCVFVCSENAALCMTEQLERIGRDGVRVRRGESVPPIVRRFERMTVLLPSMRLDCAVKALCNMSREAAQKCVLSGLCELNYKAVTNTSAAVSPGDIISVRGEGKFRLGGIEGSTRKERLRLSAEKYI